MFAHFPILFLLTVNTPCFSTDEETGHFAFYCRME